MFGSGRARAQDGKRAASFRDPSSDTHCQLQRSHCQYDAMSVTNVSCTSGDSHFGHGGYGCGTTIGCTGTVGSLSRCVARVMFPSASAPRSLARAQPACQ